MANILDKKGIFISLFVCVYVVFCASHCLHADFILLKDANKEFPVETKETGPDSITVSTSKKSILSATVGFNNYADYPDEVTLKNRARVQCKIVAMLDHKIIVKFPKSAVKSLQMDFITDTKSSRREDYKKRTTKRYIDYDNEISDERYYNNSSRIDNERYSDNVNKRANERYFDDDNQVNNERYYNNDSKRTSERYFDDTNRKSNERYYEDTERKPAKQRSYDDDFLGLVDLEEDLKKSNTKPQKPTRSAREDIKRRLLSEIQNKGSNKMDRKQSGGLDLLDKTLGNSNINNTNDSSNSSNARNSNTSKIEEILAKNDDNFKNSNIGRIKGRFLSKGDPLPSCKVRLVKLRKEGGTYYKDIENTRPLEATTDRYGVFAFDNVPPGFHKLYWKPPMESSWIRRVSMEPDVLVTAGKVAYLDDIETNQRILN